MLTRPFVAVLAITTLLASLLVAMATAASADATHAVSAGDFFFEPPELSVKTGDTVMFTNTGRLDHSITVPGSGVDQLVSPGESFALDVNDTGVVNYFCRFHGGPDGSGMAGTLFVNSDAATALGGGESHVNAALEWSKFGFEDGSAPNVLLGRDDIFADSLASGGPQGFLKAPLLLTPSDNLVSGVENELERLGANKVTILGGPAAISGAVEADLVNQGYAVERVSGVTRLHTAIEVARRFLPNADTAIVARAFSGADPTQAFADSIAAGGLSAKTGFPVVLSETEQLTGLTRDYLANSNIKTVIMAGGPAALSPAVEDAINDLGIEVQRAAGPTRWDTALALHLVASNDTLPPAEGFSTARAIVVDGRPGLASAWASGFPAAVHAINRGAVLLANGDDLQASTLRILLGDRLANSPEVVCAPNLSAEACNRSVTASTATGPFQPGTLQSFLSAVPGVDPPADGSEGQAELFPTDDPNALCFSYTALTFTGPPTNAHVHDSTMDNAAVVDMTTEQALTGEVWGCDFDVADGVVGAIQSTPSDYFVNVHTEANPGGEAQGTVFAPSFTFVADMSGDQEPGGGEEGAGGVALVYGDQDDDSRICWFYFAGLSEAPSAAHIHVGDKGVSGPVLIPLDTPSSGEIPVTWGCRDSTSDTPSTAVQVAAVQADPEGHYVNVHTDTFPDGAIRGQLRDPFGGPPTYTGSWPS